MSFIIAGLDLGIAFQWQIILLIPLSRLGGWLDPKWTCLAYGLLPLYLIDQLLVKCGISGFKAYGGLILLVGILHLIEGLLAFLYGGLNCEEAILYKEDKKVGGYQIFKKWYVPLLFFSIQGFYVPIVAVLTYVDQTFSLLPHQKARRMGLCISGYGGILICLAYLVEVQKLPVSLSVLTTAIFHEGLFKLGEAIEQKGRREVQIIQGVKIIETSQNEIFNNPFAIGDLIIRINGRPIRSEREYEMILKEARESFLVQVKRVDGRVQLIDCNSRLLRRVENKVASAQIKQLK